MSAHQSLSEDKQYDDFQTTEAALFRLLVEFKDYSLVTLDLTGHVISWNAGAEHLYGYKAAEITGKHISIFYTLEDLRNGLPMANLQLAIDKGRYEFEVLKCRKNGNQFYTNTILIVLYNTDQSVRGFAKVTRDISIQKKLEEENKVLTEQLEEKVKQRTKELVIVNKELEAFSYSVSHDLRSPLRAISGYSGMLKEDYQTKLDLEANKIIDVIISNAKLMSQLIDDLLSFSKMARLEAVTEAIDMKRLAETCMNELLQTENKIKYSVTILSMPECEGDANMLKQVWYNLISNALKYSSKKSYPQIEAGAIDIDKTSIYYVKDNGAGFDMKYAKKLFGVFQRLHRQDEFEGTGLGLALAKRIVSKHGGEMWSESLLNEGATFYFSIPKIYNDEPRI